MRPRMMLVLMLLLGVVCSLPLHAATYYVSSSGGDDSNPGTSEAQAWKTLWRVSATTFAPGDVVRLKRGDVWSDQELVLNGSANTPEEEWIAVEAYGGDPLWGPRPNIHHPAMDRTPGLIDWTSLVEYAHSSGDPHYSQYINPDRDYLRIAVRITGSGWKIKDLDISGAEVGITNYLSPGDGFWIENVYLHDLHSLTWPKHPNYPEEVWGVAPYVFGAIQMKAANTTIKDCVIIENDGDGVFLGGDGIAGRFNTALIENVYIDSMYGGGLHLFGTDITVKNVTLLNGERQGCWYGPCAVPINGCTNYLLDTFELAYTDCEPEGTADQAGFDLGVGNVYNTIRNSFIHDNKGPAFEFHVGGPKQLHTSIANNVFLHNGFTYLLDPPVGLAGDWVPGPNHTQLSTVSFTNNRIYKTSPGEKLLYIPGLKEPLQDDYLDVEAYAPGYVFSAGNNQIFTTYDDYVPPAPPISQTNIAANGYPGLTVWVSSNEADACKLIDEDPNTSWNPDPNDPYRCVSFGWDSTHEIDTIRLFDRREVGHCTRSGILDFSDGSRINVTGGILDNGAMREVVFDASKNVTWVNFAISRSEGEPGIAEFQVFAGPGPTPEVLQRPAPGSFTIDFEDRPSGVAPLTGKYPNSKNGIDWSMADWATKQSDGTRCAYFDFQPVLYEGEPIWQLKYAERTLTLPAGKKLKSMRVLAPKGAGIGVEQIGAGSFSITDGEGTWRTYSPNWTSQMSDIVRFEMYMPAGRGIHEIRIDDIQYGD